MSRKYVIIAKVNADKFVKYRTNKIDNCLQFIKKKFNNLLYANIYYKTGDQAGKQYASYGSKKGLQYH